MQSINDSIISNKSVKSVNSSNKSVASSHTSTNTKKCGNCGKPSYTKYCSECYNKHTAKTHSNCVDCGDKFYALKKDGVSKRVRCFDCQQRYNHTHFAACPGCMQSFRCLTDDR